MGVIGAVDIGGTKIAIGAVDESGRVLSKLECPTDAARGYADALVRMVTMLRQTAQNARMPISGIGIGTTGMVRASTGVICDADFLPGWAGANPVIDLARAFHVSAALENDGDAAALGEAAWGAGKGKSRIIYVTIGTGIGGGIILDGRLYRGAEMSHPEVGHHVIDLDGPPCSCGFRGCWEVMATGPAMASWFNRQSSQAERELTAEEVCQLAREGNALARRAVEREAQYLGLGLANLINLFVPEVIVLGGSVMRSAALFLDGIRKTIAQGCRFVPVEKTEIALASLGADANLIGAARVWHHRFGQQAGRAF
jgi:glucokinase